MTAANWGKIFMFPVAVAITLSVAYEAVSADDIPPARPVGLTLAAKTADSVTLAWNESTDETALEGYEIIADGLVMGFSTSNSFRCGGLIPGKSRTFRVRARDAAGNVSKNSNALLATPVAGTPAVEPDMVRTQFHALVLNYDPLILVDGSYVRAGVHYGYRNVDSLIAEYIKLMQRASGGQMVWSVASSFYLDEFAPPADPAQSPVYDAANCVALKSQGYNYGASYSGILHDPRFQIVEKVNAGEIDAIWVFGPPGLNFWETAMAGPDPYWINGAGTQDAALNRNIVFYGFGKEGHQGVGFMCENTCHMTEIILRDRITAGWPRTVATRTFNTLNLDNPGRALVNRFVTDWTHFTQAEAASWDPELVAPGGAQAGLSHFPPPALYNYDWSTLDLDFGNSWPFEPVDGAWTVENGEYHVLAANGVKTLARDGMTLSDNTGDYHPPVAFSDADIELTVRVMNGSTPSHAGFLFRMSKCQPGPNQVTGYYLGLNAHQKCLILAKLQNAFLPLTNVACAVSNATAHHIRIEARGSQIRVFLDGSASPIISIADTSFVTGGFGFATYATEAFFDNLTVVAQVPSTAEKWYHYPATNATVRYLSPLDWNGDTGTAMDGFYAWWWEHLPKNGGGHYATDLQSGSTSLLLNTWWPYVYDHNRFSNSCPFPDIVFPPEDVTSPEPPISPAALALGGSKVGLWWGEPADDIGVTSYEVSRDGALLRRTALPQFTDTRLLPNTHYVYRIRARDGSGNLSAPVDVAVTTLTSDSPGIVLNGGFEFPLELSGWSNDAFIPSQAQFEWEPAGTGRHGTRCVSITASNFNDASWQQKVTGLEAGAQYWLTGWLKGEGVVRQAGRNVGANLCLVGTWEHVPDYLDGTFDWRQDSLQFTAPQSGEVTVGCRLGYWSNVAQGKVWFDDIAIVRPTALELEEPWVSGNQFQFRLVAAPGYLCRIERSQDLKTWSEVQTFTLVHPITEISDMLVPSSGCYYRAVRAGE